MWVLLALGCTPPVAPAPVPAAADPLGPRLIEFVLDPGAWRDGTWTSETAADRLTDPPPIESVTGAFSRFSARVAPGPGEARVDRHDCGPVWVPYTVDLADTVVLPYPTCAPLDALPLPDGAALGRAEVTRDALGAMRVVEPAYAVADHGSPDLPAVWVSQAMAQAWCRWNGGRLPRRAEWEAASAGAPAARVHDGSRTALGDGPQAAPPSTGWVDLRGNVAEWLEDGTIAGGSWTSRGFDVEHVPPEARSETIGFRCAWDPRG